MAAYVEFYVACNPPLLPRGVSQVIRHVQCEEGLLEILFEPHVPWFKCIALNSLKENICTAIQDSLCAIADEDVDTFDAEETIDGDVSITTSDSRLVPWSVYQQHSNTYTFADSDIFPEPILNMKYKTTWKGLEPFSRLDFQGLLSRCHKNLGLRSAPQHQQEFEAITKCQISNNMSQTLLYIGSDESQLDFDRTVRKLDTLVHIYNNTDLVGHLVVLDSQDSPQLSYKLLSHLNLHRSTYLCYNPRNISHDRNMLAKAGTIRVKHFDAHGHWIPERRLDSKRTTAANGGDNDTLKLRNFDYKTSLVKSLHILDHEQVQFLDNKVDASNDRHKLISELNTLPDDLSSNGKFEFGQQPSSPYHANGLGRSDKAQKFDKPAILNHDAMYACDLLGDIPSDAQADLGRSTLQLMSSQSISQLSPAISDGEDLISFDLLDTVGKPSSAEPLPVQPTNDNLAVARDFSRSAAAETKPPKTSKSAKTECRPSLYTKTQMETISIATCMLNVQHYLQVVLGGFTQLPGHLSVRLVFGRVFLPHIPQEFVDLFQTLDHALAEVQSHLEDLGSSQVGFSSILSAKEADIYSLASLTPSGAQGWVLFETKVFYDLYCSFEGKNAECDVLEVNPEHGIACRSSFADCFSLYLHHPKNLWDLKLAGTQHHNITAAESSWIKSWLESVEISKLPKGGLKFEFFDSRGNAAIVQGIVIRHVFVYKQPDGDAYLSISLSRKLNKTVVNKQQTAGSLVKVTWQTPKARQSSSVSPDEWVEAHLGSSMVDAWLEAAAASQGNRGISSDILCQDERCEEAITRLVKMTDYAGNMIAQMDSIGQDNNNGQNMDIKTAATPPDPPSYGRSNYDDNFSQFW